MGSTPWPRHLGAALLGCLVSLVCLGRLAAPGHAQDRLNARALSSLPEADELFYPRFETAYVSPAVHKWYRPRNLALSYVRPFYVTDRLAAGEVLMRYQSPQLEGDEWFDRFGRRLGRGWLLYSWQQEQEARFGSEIRTSGRYSGIFQNLVVSTDGDGRSTYRLMAGNDIATFFTPLTFYKPSFDGLRLDYAADRYAGSLILSRVSRRFGGEATGGRSTHNTHLMGGHGTVQLGDLARLGITYVNAHNNSTEEEFASGNPFAGVLTARQNQPVQKLWVRIRDDSPADQRGGATVFSYDIVLADTSGQEFRGSEIGLLPAITGGRTEAGALVADGSEVLLLEYNLGGIGYEDLRSSAITRAAVELAVANDYRVELASDLQTDGQARTPETVFLVAARADGNVQDDSNSRVLDLEYSLPTGNELIGLNWDLVRWKGLSVQGEAVLNRRYGKYPNVRTSSHHQVLSRAHAAYAQLAYDHYPLGLYGEAFTIAHDYSTSYWIALNNGQINYKAPVPYLYEFVDDDDDQNGVPEWARYLDDDNSEGVAFPGYDENGDGIYDYNQNGGRRTRTLRNVLGEVIDRSSSDGNRNLIPDYEEPFLRFRSDRPEFLFGIDLNHNGTVDRFENDLVADYPYRSDHRGFNTYVQAHFGPDAELTVGRQDMGLVAGDGRTRSTYGQLTWRVNLPGLGRLRLFEFGALVRDDIRDPLQAWSQPIGSLGRMVDVPDYLPAQDTWRNILYADLAQSYGEGVRLLHRLKVERWWQRRDRDDVVADEGRTTSGFTGLMSRAEWAIPIGLGTLEPRWKSEYRSDRPYSDRQSAARSVEQVGYLMWTQPIFAESSTVSYYARYGRQIFATELQVGLEAARLWMLSGQRDGVSEGYTSRTVVVQMANRVGYLGYKLVTRAGLQVQRRDQEGEDGQTSSLVFVNVTAGLN